jgi:hypothetical protein
MHWAIASGIEGNLAGYEAVLKDIRRQQVDGFYILGDVIGPNPGSDRVVQRIRQPKKGELQPVVCKGWWEEQCLELYALGRTGEPQALIDRYGVAMTKTLWDAVSRESVEWIRRLDFGLVELDCLFIHGSSLSIEEELTPETPAVTMLDRLSRMDVNHLFCARSGLSFEYAITQGSIQSQLRTLDQPVTSNEVQVRPKRVIGVGNVGREFGRASYVLYRPESDQLQFRTIQYPTGQGFG